MGCCNTKGRVNFIDRQDPQWLNSLTRTGGRIVIGLTITQGSSVWERPVAISTGPGERISKTTRSSSGTAWYKSKGCFS
jgi:hypothetical protein